jgi:hypothetical protein
MRKIYELRAAAADSLGASRFTEQPVGTSEPISMQVWLYALPQVSIRFFDFFQFHLLLRFSPLEAADKEQNNKISRGL